MSSEEQLIYACHLIGPTLVRFNAERPHCVVELTVSLYEMLERVDHTQAHLNYMDTICDLLYPLYICITVLMVKKFNVLCVYVYETLLISFAKYFYY